MGKARCEILGNFVIYVSDSIFGRGKSGSEIVKKDTEGNEWAPNFSGKVKRMEPILILYNGS